MLTTNERERYDRQIMIKGFGEEGQKNLKRTKVIIAGSGGLALLHLSTWRQPGWELYG